MTIQLQTQVHTALHHIQVLVSQIEGPPPEEPHRWAERGIDEKCQHIRELTHAVAALIGSPPGLTLAGTEIQHRLQPSVEVLPHSAPRCRSTRLG